MNDMIGDVAFGEFGKVREFDKQASQILKRSAEDTYPLRFGQLRENHSKIVKTGAALAACQMKPAPGQDSCGTVSGRAGKNCKHFDKK